MIRLALVIFRHSFTNLLWLRSETSRRARAIHRAGGLASLGRRARSIVAAMTQAYAQLAIQAAVVMTLYAISLVVVFWLAG